MSLNIRIFNKETGSMDYFENARYIPKSQSFAFRDKEGNVLYQEINKVMQQTQYDIAGEPIFERDVIIYMGHPAMVFLDPETKNAAIYYNNRLCFLKDVIEDIELLTHIYDRSEMSSIALTDWKASALPNLVTATINTIGYADGGFQFGAYKISSSDGVDIQERFRFQNRDSNYAELFCISEALIQMRQEGSRATQINLNLTNSFAVDMMNKLGIVRSWANNGWIYKNGNPVKNAQAWNRILAAADGLVITAELISEEDRMDLVNFTKA